MPRLPAEAVVRPVAAAVPAAVRLVAAGAGLLNVVLVLATGLACRESPPSPSRAPITTAAAAPLKVALLHPGRENDRGWNQLAYDALQALHSRGAEVRHTLTPNRSNFKSDMRAYAEQGYAVVFCHGSEFVKAAREAAREFPATRFVVTGSADAGQGVATIDFRLWEATYLCGVLAAHLVPGGPAGLIGGEDFVTVRKTLDAFAGGARSQRPDYGVFAQYVGSWDDIARAQQTARSLIETRGVRVIFQNTDAAATGVFRAAADAGVIVFGCNSDQNDVDGKRIPASAVIRMDLAFRAVLDRLAAGTLRDDAIVGDLANGLIEVRPNERFLASRGPAGEKATTAMNEARKELVAGRLDPLKPVQPASSVPNDASTTR